MRKLYVILISSILISCQYSESVNSGNISANIFSIGDSKDNVNEKVNFGINMDRESVHPTKLSHDINTSASEYLPCPSINGDLIIFSAMDRTGYFENKIDFTKTRKFGGEDVFISELKNGIWEDAKPIEKINTNFHETVSQLMLNGNLIITGNYQENMGPISSSNGSATTDIFMAKKNNNYNLFHFDEPINSIYTEADGFMTEDANTFLFVSDRPGHIGDYHKKGWMWNDSYWGNTDIYVSFKDGDSWSNPKNLGKLINSPYTERSPFLSNDGLRLYLSSNGYKTGKKDLDIYYYKRKNRQDWEHWEGPFETQGLNSDTDEWGYKEDSNGNMYFSKANKLGFIPTKKGRDGTGFVFETNFRSGYSVFGLQTASFKQDEQTDIYIVRKNNVAIVLPDILFSFDSYKLKTNEQKLKDKIIDFIKVNNPKKISIIGYTDSDGTDVHNLELSLNRAKTIQELIINDITNCTILIDGKGKLMPVAINNSKENKQKNRRVEITFE